MGRWNTLFKKYKRSSIYHWLARTWTRIIIIGLRDSDSDWDKRRIRLLNGICAMGMLALTVYCVSYLNPTYILTFWESFQGLVAYAFVMFLTSRHRFNLACHVFNLYNIASYSFQAISHGNVDGVEYILVASSIASMLLFKELWIIIFYFLLNGLAFAICKYSFTVMKPFLFMANGDNVYASNHVLMFVILFLIVYYFKSENKQQEKLLEDKNTNLADEKQKSDNLLLNILPGETAEELKQTGAAKPRSFKMVTVMFTDFKDFTLNAEKIPADELVSEINHYFSTFDLIMDKYNIEKIKTIGDSYMCAGGMPLENDSHPIDVVAAALEIQEFMRRQKEEREACFELRLGIHTGPVVAGIVGSKKFAYDIWGDTVNVASRMESCGEVGKVNISGSTYQLVKDRFSCTYRGRVAAKNKGAIDMYFVEGPIENNAPA